MFRHFKSLILLPRLLIRLKHITRASKAGAIKHSEALFLGKELLWPLHKLNHPD